MKQIMIHIDEVIIVEGKYDKMQLERVCDATIFTTEGFRIFKDSQKRKFFTELSKKRGIIILTDSDRAGNMIRNHIKGLSGIENIHHAYIPEIFGKEKRKATPSKEGKLGVEGIDEEKLCEVLLKFSAKKEAGEKLTKIDLYDAKLYGGSNSTAARLKLSERLGIPSSLSPSAFLDALNALLTKEEFYELTEELLCTKDTDND